MRDLRFFEELGVELERAARRPRAGRRAAIWAAIGASGATVAAGIVVVVLLLSSGAGVAYAGWSPTPTTATPADVAPALTMCDRAAGLNLLPTSHLTPPAISREPSIKPIYLKPVLTEVRDKYVAVIARANGAVYVCIDGDRGNLGRGESRYSVPAAALPGRISSGLVIRTGGHVFVDGREVHGLATGNHAFGRAGRGVSAVKFTFTNKPTVTATVQHGWYFAWWPWASTPTSVQVTTTTGTTTSPAHCVPATSGCVFSSTTPTPAPTTNKP